MSMKIITPFGVLKECFGVKPFVEELYKCKDKEIRRAHYLESKDEVPSGIKLVIPGRCIYIGNMKSDVIKSIIETLFKTGTYDFSNVDYQEPKREENDRGDTEFFVWDDEKSKPYHTEDSSTYEDDIISNLLGYDDNIHEGDMRVSCSCPCSMPHPMMPPMWSNDDPFNGAL